MEGIMDRGKILYFEAPDGISGDMVLGALIDLGADVAAIKREMDKLVPGEYDLAPQPFERNGIHGINLHVIVSTEHGHDHDHSHRHGNDQDHGDDHGHGHDHEHSQLHDHDHDHSHGHDHGDDHGHDPDQSRRDGPDHSHDHDHTQLHDQGPDHSDGPDHSHGYDHEDRDGHAHLRRDGHDHGPDHSHRHYRDIKEMIVGSAITDRAKAYALAVFGVIAEAEAAVHHTEKEEVAFHEVGAMDSIIDIVGTAIALDILGVTDFYCAAPHDGSGTITCRHGLIPVPVPAVMEMLKGCGIPIVIESEVNTEMITPTGFGIIKGLRMKFVPSLGIAPERTGYGFGKRDTGRLGAVRVTLGEIPASEV